MSRKDPRGGRHKRRRQAPRRRGPSREQVEELHPIENPPLVESFHEWDLGEDIQRSIEGMDITVPTPIQSLAIGPVLEGRDVIAKAETGTGKTLAFGAPMMARIDASRSTVLGLVLCPTRELAQQVADVLSALALFRGVKVALVVGGDPMHPQVNALQAGAQVVVGTPGRVLDLYEQRFLSFPWTEYVVLDEADKMFEIGFLDDVKKILSFTPEERQTLLFSATFPTEVLKLARSSTRNPVEVATARGTATVESIRQGWIRVEEDDKPYVISRMLKNSRPKDVYLIFCDRRTEVDRLIRRLERLPFELKALHGGYDQAARFRVMSAFRTGEVKALIATDVASRGLDVQHVTHVINYSAPREVEDYTHRIGRTGRAGRSGVAITLVSPQDNRRMRAHLGRVSWEIPEWGPDGEPLQPARESARSRSDRRESSDRERGEGRETDRQRPRGRGRGGDRDREGRGGERERSRERGSEREGGRQDRPPRRERTESRRPDPEPETRERRTDEDRTRTRRRRAREEDGQPAPKSEERPARRNRRRGRPAGDDSGKSSSRDRAPAEAAVPARDSGSKSPRKRPKKRDDAKSQPQEPKGPHGFGAGIS